LHTPRAFHAFSRVLRNPDYGVYTVGNSISLIGTWIQRVAVGWLAWELTRSGAWLGILALADAVFTIVVGLAAGTAADRWDRMRIIKTGQWAMLLQAVLLFALTVTDTITMPRLLVLTAFLGMCSAFVQPARHSLVPSLVPLADLPTAVAINSVAFNTARFIGPAIAGILIATLGIESTFAANAVTFAVFLVALARIRVRPGALPSRDTRFVRDLTDGIRYTATHASIGPLLSMMVVTSLAGRAVAELLPAFSDVVFGAGTSGLAVLTSSMGAGAVTAGIWLGGQSETKRLVRTVLFGVFCIGLSMMAFTATDTMWVGVPALVVAGACSTLIGVGTQTLIFMAAPNAMRGRVLSIYGLIVWGGPALGALIMGAWSDVLGFRLPLFVGGLFITAAWAWGYNQRHKISAGLAASEPGGAAGITGSDDHDLKS
jgi:MFS family permease